MKESNKFDPLRASSTGERAAASSTGERAAASSTGGGMIRLNFPQKASRLSSATKVSLFVLAVFLVGSLISVLLLWLLYRSIH